MLVKPKKKELTPNAPQYAVLCNPKPTLVLAPIINKLPKIAAKTSHIPPQPSPRNDRGQPPISTLKRTQTNRGKNPQKFSPKPPPQQSPREIHHRAMLENSSLRLTRTKAPRNRGRMPPITPHCQNRKALARGGTGVCDRRLERVGGELTSEERRRSESPAASGLGFRAPRVVSLQRLAPPPSLSLSLLRRAPLRSRRLKTEEKSFRVLPLLFVFLSGPKRVSKFFF